MYSYKIITIDSCENVHCRYDRRTRQIEITYAAIRINTR